MAIYTVHEPAGLAGRSEADADTVVFIKDGLCWPALLVPVLWIVYHGMWLVLLIYLAVMIGVEVLLQLFGLSEWISAVVAIGIAFLFALEATSVRRWHLARKGYAQTAIVSGQDLEDAERRFFSSWLAEPAQRQPIPAKQVQPIPQRMSPSAAGGVIGVFPQPGGRS